MKISKTYKAYGLIWQLPFECPEYTPCDEHPPDIIVRHGSIADKHPVEENRVVEKVSPKNITLNFQNVARYKIINGQEIIIQPVSHASENEVRQILLGTCSALLLHQRGVLPLHASAIATQHGAILFCGHSGYGKSSIAGALLKRGYAMLADDITAIILDSAGMPIVLPGYPQIKLWADSAEKLDQSTNQLRQIHPDYEKFALPTQGKIAAEPLPLRAIFALNPSEETAIKLEPLYGEKKLKVLLDYTGHKMLLKEMKIHKDHFIMVSHVASLVRISHIQRPKNQFLLDELADQLEKEFMNG